MPLIFPCYVRPSAVAHAVAVNHYPNTDAISHEIANSTESRLLQPAQRTSTGLRPSRKVLLQAKLSSKFRDTLSAFEAARLCCLVASKPLPPIAASLEELGISLSLTMMLR